MNKEMRTNQPGILLMTDKDCALQITEAGLTVNGTVLPFEKAGAWIMEAFNEKAARELAPIQIPSNWIKTADQPPTAADANAAGLISAVFEHNGRFCATTHPWDFVAENATRYVFWCPLPRGRASE